MNFSVRGKFLTHTAIAMEIGLQANFMSRNKGYAKLFHSSPFLKSKILKHLVSEILKHLEI